MSPSSTTMCVFDQKQRDAAVVDEPTTLLYEALHERYASRKRQTSFLARRRRVGKETPGAVLAPRAAAWRSARITLRPMNKKRFAEEVERVKALTTRRGRRTGGLCAVDGSGDRQPRQASSNGGTRGPPICRVAEARGEVIAIGVRVPDFNSRCCKRSAAYFRAPQGSCGHSRKINRRACCSGREPGIPGQGIDGRCTNGFWQAWVKPGMRGGEGGGFSEDNAPMTKAALAEARIPTFPKTYASTTSRCEVL